MYFVIKFFLEEIQALIANIFNLHMGIEEHNLLTEFDLKFWKVSDGSLSLDKCHYQRYLTILFLCSNCNIDDCEYYENGMCELQSNLCSKEHYL